LNAICGSHFCCENIQRAPTRPLALALLLALGAIAQAAAAEAGDVIRVEVVGAVPVGPQSTSPRDAAVHSALRDAVWQAAHELLGAGAGHANGDPLGEAAELEADAQQRAELERILGSDPLAYVSRFQVVEDRGAGPALFGADPDVDTEYVVIASVFVDRDRIRERLARAGVALAPIDQAPQLKSRLILEGVDEHWVYQEIRRVLLEELKLRSAIPREFTAGRAVLELSAAQAPSEVLAALQSSLADRMELVPLSVEADEMRVRVELRAVEAPEAPPDEPAPIDTTGPNRY
jgi:hypothetical protein